MKLKISTITTIVILLPLLSLSQTPYEVDEILSASNPTQINALKTQLQIDEAEKNSRIEAYIEANPGVERHQIRNGKKFTIVDVVDNKPLFITTHNDTAAKATRADFMHQGGGLGLNIEGQNMYVGVWDGGNVLIDHQEFYGTFPNSNVIRVTTPDFEIEQSYSDHGTHVAGTIAAKGAEPQAKGMAPRATVVSYDWTSDLTEVEYEIENNGLLVSNHSYGIPVQVQGEPYVDTWRMGCYDSQANLWDNLHYTFPYYIQVVSAGNDGNYSYPEASFEGYDKLTAEKNSKNNLVVANAQDPNISNNGDLVSLSINQGSSQGPSDDGRIKPDITGNGTLLYSPVSTSTTSYGNYSGTSMAAPNVAGSILLLQQYYNDINNNFMRSSTLKGLVCHTADDDSSRVGPDAIYGWGLLNVKTASETILDASNGNAMIMEGTLLDGESYTTTFSASSDGPISATLCWTDPAGTPQNGSSNSTTPALVNDLDLVLIDPNGFNNYYAWRLNAASPASSATKGINFVDTVENVDIENPNSGTYTISITHKGNLTNGEQNFSLIVTGSNLTLGTANVDISGLHVWPNPAQSEISFEYPSSDNSSTISLVDIQGRVVFQNEIASENGLIKGQIDTASFARGLYVLKIKQGNTSTQKKIILK
ncbi:MAG: S8 family serine peptidase [Flavobacteriaceae bacterium]